MSEDEPKHTEVLMRCRLIGMALIVIGYAMNSFALMLVGGGLVAGGAALS